MAEYLIQGVYPYEIPDFKGDEKLIINHDIRKKSDQYWKKQYVPKKFDSKREEMKWIDREEDRLANGIYFLNNGELTFINGSHYRFLQFYTGDFGANKHPNYWNEHRLYYYFLDWVKKHDKLRGDFTIKPRRAGVTQIHNSDSIEIATNDFMHYVGLMSANVEKAKKFQFRPIRNAIMKYPPQFRPKFKMTNGKVPQKELEFEPEYENDNMEYLEGWIATSGTTATGFDAAKLHGLKVDEILKWLGIDPMTVIDPQMETMKLPHTGEIVGKASLFSTMGLDDKGMRLAIDRGTILWEGSNYNELNKLGTTSTGFARYFMSALDTHMIDLYGYSNRELVEEEYIKDLNDIFERYGEGSKEHIKKLRTEPRTINDVFNSPKLGSAFNNDGRISQRKIYVVSIPEKDNNIVRGRFREDINGKIILSTSNEDRDWWQLDKAFITNIQRTNNVSFRNGEFFLPQNPEIVLGYDPVKLEETTSKHISNPAGGIYKKCDHYSKTGIENKFVGLTLKRTNDLDELAEQIGFAARFCGAWIAPEANVGERWFRREGYNQMVIKSPYEKRKGIYISTTGKGRKAFIDGIALISDFIKAPKLETDLDLLQGIDYVEMLSQLESFDADKLPTHDIIAMMMQCLITASKIMKPTARNYAMGSIITSFFGER